MVGWLVGQSVSEKNIDSNMCNKHSLMFYPNIHLKQGVRLVGRSVGRSVSRSVGQLVGRSLGWSVGRSVGWLVGSESMSE